MAAPGTPWFKLYGQMRNHPKIIGLARELKVSKIHAIGLVVNVWCWVLEYAPDGYITSEQLSQSLYEAGVKRGHKRIKDALQAFLLLEVCQMGYKIHNWFEYAESYKRAIKQKKKRESTSTSTSTSTSRVPVQVPSERRGEERKREERRGDNTLVDLKADHGPPPMNPSGENDVEVIKSVFEHYRKHHPRSHPKPHSGMKEWRLIRDRIKEGYSAEDLRQAIDGCHISPFHCGVNNKSRKFQNLELIVRDGGKVREFMELHSTGPPPALSERTRKTVYAVQQFVNEENKNQ